MSLHIFTKPKRVWTLSLNINLKKEKRVNWRLLLHRNHPQTSSFIHHTAHDEKRQNYSKALFPTTHSCISATFKRLNDDCDIERYHTTKIIHLLHTKINFISFIHFFVYVHKSRRAAQEEDDDDDILYSRERASE